MQEKKKKISALVLDLGGVVFRIDWMKPAQILGLANSKFEPFLLKSIGTWETYDRFERGEITSEDFFKKFQSYVGMEIPETTFWKAWKSLIRMESLIQEVKKNTPVFALTNTNRAHLDYITETYPVMGEFQRVFSSCEMGCRKPEPRIFTLLQKALGIAAGEVLFIDDMPANVQAARSFGFQAEEVLNSAEILRKRLIDHGLL